MKLSAAIGAALAIAAFLQLNAHAAQIPINDVKKVAANAEGFCPRGWEPEDELIADLQGKGSKDKVIILTSSKKLGSPGMQQTSYRALLVAFAKHGKLQLIDWSTKLLLCTTCGGQLGAEIGLEKIKGGFKVSQSGGGGNDSFEYATQFKYDAGKKQFVVTSAVNTTIGDRVNQDNVVEVVNDYEHGLRTTTKTNGGKEKKASTKIEKKTIFLRDLDADKLNRI